MKIAILLVDGGKQVMLTPETDHEKQALKMIAPGDVLEAVTKWGTFGNGESKHYGMEVSMSKAGYYRMYEDNESLMFVISDPSKPQKP